MENNLKQNLSARQKQVISQKQTISQKQLQSVELLALSNQELEKRLLTELETNPLLEEYDIRSGEQLSGEENMSPSDAGDEEDFFTDTLNRNIWGDDLPSAGNTTFAAAEKEWDLFANVPASPPSIKEQLEAEVATSVLPPRMKELAEKIIDSLDERGVLVTHLADIAMLSDASMEEAEEALRLVQGFEPAGIAARDVCESLRLQLERKGRLTPLLEKLTTLEGLEDIARNRISHLAAECGVSIGEITAAVAELRKLNPYPASEVSPANPVDAELEILPDGDDFVVVELHPRDRHLFIPERYQEMLLDPGLSAEDRKFFNEKINAARELLKALYDRSSTIAAIGKVLVKTQREFFRQGPSALKPLTMKQAGEIIGRDESTVSRAVKDKYIRTPQGFHPLRYFFSSGFVSSSGEDVSAHAVQEKIRKLIGSEDPHHPLSDEKLAQLLKKEGLDVARRTVAKYREMLKIPKANLRKKF